MSFGIFWIAARNYESDLDALDGVIQFAIGDYRYGELLPRLPMTHTNLVVWRDNLRIAAKILAAGRSASIVDFESASNWIVFDQEGTRITVQHVKANLHQTTSFVRDEVIRGDCLAEATTTTNEVLVAIEGFASGIDAEVGVGR